MGTLNGLFDQAEILRIAGFDAYGYRGAHQQSMAGRVERVFLVGDLSAPTAHELVRLARRCTGSSVWSASLSARNHLITTRIDCACGSGSR
jgi:hypothetical protein